MKLLLAIFSLLLVCNCRAQGPYEWRNVEIVGGGFVTGIIFHPAEKDLVYARTDIGGMYRLNPQTNRWICLNDWADLDNWNMYGAESVGIDPTDPNRLYMAGGTYTNDWAGNGAILRSTDRGDTWQRTDLPFKFGGNEDGRSIGERLAVDPHSNNIVYFGTRNNGMWISKDFGETWNQLDSFPIKGRTNRIGIGIVIFDPSSGEKGKPTPTIYAAVASKETHLYRSTDAGQTWEEVSGQTKGFMPHHAVLTPQGILYLAYGNGPGPNGVTDGAVRKLNTRTGEWTDITPLKPGGPDQNFGYAGLSVDAKNPDVLIVSTLNWWSHRDEIFRSLDGGKTWKGIQALSERDHSIAPYLTWDHPQADFGHWIGDVEIDPYNPDRAMYVTGATIWLTKNLTAVDRGEVSKWTVGAEGLEECAILDMISPPVGPHLISAMGDLGGFRHDDFAVSPRDGVWTDPFITSCTSIDFAQDKPDFVVRVGRGQRGKSGAFSADAAKTWTGFATEPAGSTQGGGIIAISPDGAAIVWSPTDASPHRSTDQGKTWKPCAGVNAPAHVVADRVNPRKFYALDIAAATFYISEDAGESFKVQNSSVPPEGRKFRAVAGKEGHLWLPAESGLYRSTDSGASFAKVPGVELALAVGVGKAAPGKDYQTVFVTGSVGGIKGAYRSDDEGATWLRITDDQHQYGSINETIIGDPRRHGRVYMGTNGRGILYGDPKQTQN